MRSRTRLLLDLALLAALLVAFYPKWTGLPVHQWLSIAIVGPLLVHLIVNWQWAARVVATFFRKLFSASRLNFAVDSILLVATVTVMLSGFMVSPELFRPVGIRFALSPAWRVAHSWSANVTVALLLLHGALHWRWAWGVVRRMVVDAGAWAHRGASASPGTAAAAAAGRSVDAQRDRRSRARDRARKAAAERAAVTGTAAVLALTSVVAVAVFGLVMLANPLAASSRVPARTLASASAADGGDVQVCPATGCKAVGCHADTGADPATFYTKSQVASGHSATAAPAGVRQPASGGALLHLARPKGRVLSRTFAVAAATVAKTPRPGSGAGPGPARAAAGKPASTSTAARKMTCPSTGCSASTCHAEHGASARTWYATHS
jgi:hypothetical protein